MALSKPRDSYTQRALLTRLLEEPGAAEASHLIVAALVAALLWGQIPTALLVTWLSGVMAIAALRVYVRRRAGKARRTLARTPPILRFSIIAVAFAWGLGTLVAVPFMTISDLALLMVVFCGLSAAASATLLGDPPAYYGYLTALLVPLALSIMRVATGRVLVVAVVLVALFGAVMTMLFRRLHRVLLGSVESARSLAISQSQAERERSFLDALIASAPVAIVVLDGEGCVVRANPAFERTFGYEAAEAKGQRLDELIVSGPERETADELTGRVAAGATVALDAERRRKDGSVVYVRISAAPVPGGGGTLVLYDDITEAKAAERRLRESEQRWFQTLEGLPMGILVVDRRGAPLFANPVAKQLLGRGVVEGASGDQLAEVYQSYVAGTPELYPTERMPVMRALRGEHTRVDDIEIRRDDGTITLEVFGSPITDARGDIVLGVAAFTDITERRRRTERVRARHEVVRALAEAAPDAELLPDVMRAVCSSFGWDAGATWQVDRADGVLRLAGFWHGDSPRGLDLHRVSLGMTFRAGEGVPGKIWESGGPVWFPEFAADAMPRRAQAAAAGELRSAIGLPLRVAGEVVGVLEFFGASMHEPDPELIGTLEIIGSQVGQALERHGSERARRQAEAQYRELVEAASDLVWRIDLEGRLTFLNGAAQQVYGRSPEELLGRHFSELADGASVERDREAIAGVMAGGELMDYETVHRDASGNVRHLSTSARPIRDAAGAIVGVQGIARDVSERAAAREALRAARDAAEQAAAARSAFLANMSHEIRTPINGVLGMAELLLDSELSDGDRRSVEMIVSSGEALLGVINDILDFSKIEAQQMDIEVVEFDLPSVVEATARLVMSRANAKGVELVPDIADAVPQYVRGDPTRLRQVLTNLLGNAVKFTAQGEVVVRVAPAARGDGWLRVSVRDTGVGIPAEKLESIFEPFRQVDATTTRRYGGTGLGLSISRRLVALMGGTLSVNSIEGQGSEFWFELSLPAAPGAEAAPMTRADLKDARVLVVDDNPTNRHVMQRVLQQAGCAVDPAEHGREALARLRAAVARRVPYRLVVTDLFMPEMDGFELVEAIRADTALADSVVVMLSSAVSRGDPERARALGVSALLLKPAGRTELVDAASRALGLSPSAPRRAGGAFETVPEGEPGLRILLAEDNMVNQEVAATMLRRRGHRVEVVENGRQAVEAVEQSAFDLVLMDLQMPEMDGFQATAAIRKLPGGPAIPIVAITANAMVGERERCLAAGMDGYVSKPYKPHELFAAVESAVAAGTAPGGVGGRGGERPPAERTEPGNPVDLDAFRAEMRAAGVESAVDGILEVFLTDAPSKLAQLESAATTDARAIERAAHAFKSSAGTIHALRLSELLRETEMDARNGSAPAAVAHLPAIRDAYTDVMEQLRAHRESTAPHA